MSTHRIATVAEIEAAARDFAAKVADLPIEVRPNAYGVRAECLVCHTSWTHNVLVSVLRDHAATH